MQGARQTMPNCGEAPLGARHGPQGVSSLWADLGTEVAQRLVAESVSAGLVTELAEAWRILQAKSDEHDLLRAAIRVVFDDLEVARPEGTSSIAASAAVDITAWVR